MNFIKNISFRLCIFCFFRKFTLIFFNFGWIGGGDAKLLAASCLWMGMSGVAPFLIYTGIAGGAFCLLLMTARQYFPMVAPSVSQGWVINLMQPKGDIPYGVAIAIGALLGGWILANWGGSWLYGCMALLCLAILMLYGLSTRTSRTALVRAEP